MFESGRARKNAVGVTVEVYVVVSGFFSFFIFSGSRNWVGRGTLWEGHRMLVGEVHQRGGKTPRTPNHRPWILRLDMLDFRFLYLFLRNLPVSSAHIFISNSRRRERKVTTDFLNYCNWIDSHVLC